MKCQHCQGRSQLYLCPTCTGHLRGMYFDLAIGPRLGNGHRTAGLLEHLRDSAAGNNHAGTAPGPHNHSIPAAPKPNGRAVSLLGELHTQLVRTAAALPVPDGIACPRSHFLDPDFIGPLLPGWRRGTPTTWQPTTEEVALWLAAHARNIAARQQAATTYRDLKAITERILRAIDRPCMPRFCGPCPGDGTTRCGHHLQAHPDATTVRCPECGTRHNVHGLIQRLFTLVGHWSFPREQLLGIMAGFGQPIPPRTFRYWRATGQIHPTGYLAADGKRHKHQTANTDEPIYRLNDARKLKTRRAPNTAKEPVRC